MIITLVSLFVESKEMGYLYNCVFHVEKENQGRNEVMIITEFYRQNTNAHYSNDNYNEISLESLIRHLKHNEPVSVEMEGLCIDFEDMTIRNMLYSIHFLSDINCCDIRIKLSAHKMTFLLRFNSNALQERLPDDEGGEVLR